MVGAVGALGWLLFFGLALYMFLNRKQQPAHVRQGPVSNLRDAASEKD